MPRVHAFIAEHSTKFIHTLKAADNQPLQIQFRRDPKIQFRVERIMMSGERSCRRASRYRRQHRRFDFDETALVEIFSDRFNDLGAFDEHVAHLGIDDKIEVALPISDLDVFEPVEFLRQRSQRLA